MTTPKPPPRMAIELSKLGMTSAPTVAKIARTRRIMGRRKYLALSRRLCCLSAARQIWVSEAEKGGGVDVPDGSDVSDGGRVTCGVFISCGIRMVG